MFAGLGLIEFLMGPFFEGEENDDDSNGGKNERNEAEKQFGTCIADNDGIFRVGRIYVYFEFMAFRILTNDGGFACATAAGAARKFVLIAKIFGSVYYVSVGNVGAIGCAIIAVVRFDFA